MEKRLLQMVFGFIMLLFLANTAAAHCEVPCGIYDDQMRIKMILEHAATIEKAMEQIVALQGEGGQGSNQLVRWIMNKEQHADELQHIVSQYFMTQRIKPDTANYDKKLALLHQMLIAAMKCKQTTDIANVGKLRDLVKSFQELYFTEK